MMISGAGWVGENAFGAVHKKIQNNDIEDLYPSLKAEGVFAERVKNFGRFDVPTRRAFCAAALALHDADFVVTESPVGLIGGGTEECTFANQKYFLDYAEHGRKLARANLFIYTLPTSPLAEIAICFKLDGPLFFTSSLSNSSAHLMNRACGLIEEGAASSMLILWMEKDFAGAFLLQAGENNLPHEAFTLKTPAKLIEFLKENII